MFAKLKGYNPLVNLDCFLVAPISKDVAAVRAGRAGKDRPGHCFRLCTQQAFEVRNFSSFVCFLLCATLYGMHCKARGYIPIMNLVCLLVAPISKDVAAVRAGCPERERPGHCFRLCTQQAFKVCLSEFTGYCAAIPHSRTIKTCF
jgi:HrpA-like RNA helicase